MKFNTLTICMLVAISLPNQSINEDKSNQLTNARNLTLSDLVAQLRHYNAGSRKDAIQGLRDLFNRYPAILPSSLSTIVNSIVRLLIDDDGDVRKALLSFLKEYLAALNKSDLQPFLPLLIIYTCSAITHIQEDIRSDAIKFMDLWIDVAPEVVVGRFWKKVRNQCDRKLGVLGNYTSLLDVNSNAANISKGSGLESSASSSSTMFANQRSNRGSEKDGVKRRHDLVEWNEYGKTTTLLPHAMCASFLPYLSPASFSSVPVYSHLSLFGSTGTDEKRKSDIAVGAKGDKEAADEEADKPDVGGRMLEVKVGIYLDCSLDDFGKVLFVINTLCRDLLGHNQHASTGLARYLVGHRPNSVFRVGISAVHVGASNRASRAEGHGGAVESDAERIGWCGMNTVLSLFVFVPTLYSVDQTWIDSHLQQLLRHFMIYFPFGSDTFGMRDARVRCWLSRNTVINCWMCSHYNNCGKISLHSGENALFHQVESILQDMSILFCELTSLFLLATTLSSTSDVKSRNAPSEQPTIVPAIVHKAGKRRRKTRSVEDVEGGEGKTPAWVERVVEYVLAVLGWENPAQSVVKKPRLSNPLMTTSTTDFKPEHLAALLPTLWGLLNCLGEEKQEWVFEALLGYFKKSHAHSATKRISLEFIIQIYMIQTDPQYTGLFRIRVFSRFAKLLQAWVLGLPKLLWELKAGSMETSRVFIYASSKLSHKEPQSHTTNAYVYFISNSFTGNIGNVVRYCKKAGKKRFRGRDCILQVFDTLEKSMIPFYYVNVPNKGPLFGPFLSLTEDLQLTALEFLFYMPKISDKMETALRECCENEAMSEKTKQYLGEVMRNSSFGE
ncbi:hypothetical protein BC938DRAFT_477408 [Jimgerdemannia flammicorona]|uniref:Pre-rRNA-processing protein n=1 Tax=Jimgerdemannia flammicorona TaxID=994334 RepID=A0A433QYU7_9FUNG|nr:hypothetical protein BC938DRAFT_477408 [Jimgerdemannia flammicorona]